eukprot:15347718-Ditylum_brightwellii.AAC.1
MGTRRTSYCDGGVAIKMSEEEQLQEEELSTFEQNARCQQLRLSKHGADDSHASTVQRHNK